MLTVICHRYLSPSLWLQKDTKKFGQNVDWIDFRSTD